MTDPTAAGLAAWCTVLADPAGTLEQARDAAIQAAITATRDGGTTEYGVRCTGTDRCGDSPGEIFMTGDRDRLAAYAARADNCYELVSRHVGRWEVAS